MLNEQFKSIKILKSAEVDILEDGTLDLEDEILGEMDIVICAVHSSFKLTKEKQTSRILKAINHKCTNILAHPTGRLIQERSPYDIDLTAIINAAKNNNCALEINGQPSRLDLSKENIKLAQHEKVKFVISSDLHSKNEFNNIQYGINQARRAWLEKKDVINSWPLKEAMSFFKKK